MKVQVGVLATDVPVNPAWQPAEARVFVCLINHHWTVLVLKDDVFFHIDQLVTFRCGPRFDGTSGTLTRVPRRDAFPVEDIKGSIGVALRLASVAGALRQPTPKK